VTTKSAAEQVSASVWRLPLASDTLPPFDTTNTYIIADGGVAAVVDPGFRDEAGMAGLESALSALGVRFLKSVLLTHTHPDHVAGVASVLSRYGSPAVYTHPLELPRLLPELPSVKALTGGRTLMIGDLAVTALHTPGHSPGHLSFHVGSEEVVLAGDLVAQGSSVWVGLPEGNVSHYLDSLDLLMNLPRLRFLGPGHGEVIDRPYRHLTDARAHRLAREEQILMVLEESGRQLSLDQLVGAIYEDLNAGLVESAKATLLAHLSKLMQEMRVLHLGEDIEGPYAIRR